MSARIRKGTGAEMLRLWGYACPENVTDTARFFFANVSSGNAIFWTAEDPGGELIGELYAFLDLRDDREFADGHTTAYLCAFRVRKDRRGEGIGSRMMETALADLRARGFRRATIGVDDARNERLYRRMGFSRKVKDCFLDPCAVDGDMRPARVGEGYLLLAKEL